MKRNMKYLVHKWIVAVPLLMIPSLLLAQQRKTDPEEIRITSYDVGLREFDKPLIKLDEKGIKKTYTKAYVVTLKGNFGEPGAIPVDIYIGDHKIPEYGGTRDGIYFMIYDDKLIEELEGKPFGYGFESQKTKTVKLKFTPSEFKPFKKLKNKQ